MSSEEDIRAAMDLHLKVQSLSDSQEALARRLRQEESRTDLLQASFLRLEQDSRRQAEAVQLRLDAIEERQAQYQEDTNTMIEGALIVGRQNTDSISGLAELQQYKEEITDRAKSDRFWAEAWRRASAAKGKIFGLGSTIGGIGASWHYWDSWTEWLKALFKSGGNG